MRKRFENKRREKDERIHIALNESQLIIDKIPCGVNFSEQPLEDTLFFNASNIFEEEDSTCVNSFFIDWTVVPESLDPASGELNELRASRKRAQITSLIYFVELEISSYLKFRKPSELHIIEFGAGSGHLGLLIAFRHPYLRVTLAERKAYSVNIAQKRISDCGLTNVNIFNNDLKDVFLDGDTFSDISIGVALHSCGLLTDIALHICNKYKASFVITPCCYGQIANPPPENTQILDSYLQKSLRSKLFNLEASGNLCVLSSGADYSTNFKDEVADISSEKNFILAKRCMRCLDMDRILTIQEQDGSSYFFKLTSLYPLTCSPKNNIIIGRRAI